MTHHPTHSRRRFLRGIAGIAGAGSLSPRTMEAGEMPPQERSFWLHASLGLTTQNGYWGWGYRETRPPTPEEIGNALQVLTRGYHANRLYLIYHREIPSNAAREMFRQWRRQAPPGVEIVPTLLLKMYDPQQRPVFASGELAGWVRFFREKINRQRVAVYDIYPKRDPGEGLDLLARSYPGGLIRVGLQPGEPLTSPYTAGVEDTWSGFCHGRTHADWLSLGFGAQTLRGWVEERNRGSLPVSWDLVAVAWDYSVTQRGEYPGYDDADRNMPLPAGRNRLAVKEIRATAHPDRLLGFSSDLFILHVNSLSRKHDGPAGSLYEVLKRGHRYRGYYSAALDEIGEIYGERAAD